MKKIVFLFIVMAPFLTACKATKMDTENSKMKNSEQAKELLQFFPEAEKGFTKQVLTLPVLSKEKEENRRVELFVGKVMLVDCNLHSLSGQIQQEVLEGYGYNYYKFKTEGRVTATMMRCPDESKREEYVAAPSLVRDYNSNYPIIVYVPEGYEVRYKVWVGGVLEKLDR